MGGGKIADGASPYVAANAGITPCSTDSPPGAPGPTPCWATSACVGTASWPWRVGPGRLRVRNARAGLRTFMTAVAW